MRSRTMAVIVGVAIGVACALGQSTSGGPEGTVRRFLRNISTQPSANSSLFTTTNSIVVAYSNGRGIDASNFSTAEDWVAWTQSEKMWTHVIDGISSRMNGDNLATVSVTGQTTGGTSFKHVYALTREGGSWTILAFVAENQ